ncbi:MAG: glycerol-3-phosphate dehydrogenase/oxidase [Actinomycetia bacterium]|nr:glycerol-3-phosphate dehydrogenase/oxidase [Actinomycetes bacterium]
MGSVGVWGWHGENGEVDIEVTSGDDPSALGPGARDRGLARLESEPLDILVIGGGVVGAGCALDAASRGLRVGLVEQRDLASGTSSRSSKLIHGGLRYLEQFDFGLVAEALRERGLMLSHLAPHLVKPVSFLYPLQKRLIERPYVGAGVALYDVMASRGSNPLPRHRHLTRSGARRLAPSLAEHGLIGAVRYWDAQVDDARHTAALARTAARHGASIVTSARVVDLLRDSSHVIGARVRDLESGREFDVKARRVVNATGVWTDEIQDHAGGSAVKVRASKGIHILVPRSRIDSATGLILRTPSSVLFVIPWGANWIIGTTDTDWELDMSHPAASRNDIEYVLDQVNRVLTEPLDTDDIVGVYAGLRPLLHGESDATSKLSREHAVAQPAPGLITVAGGKYTTYRVMAEDAIDLAVEGLDSVSGSVTADLALVGADGWRALVNRRHELARSSGLDEETIDHLLSRHGYETLEVLDLVAADPDLGRPVHSGAPYLRAEVIRACTHEGALHLDDVLTRRTRLSIETSHRGVDSADDVAELMGRVLGWDDSTSKRELEHYRARVEAEIESQTMLTDETADAARLGAPDVRRGRRGPDSGL